MSVRDPRGQPRLLGIGGFALATGLSVPALRHYDEIGLLPPAEVDPVTGYRRYAPEQADRARLIGLLRSVDLPLADVAAVLAADEAGARALLAAHRERLRGRVRELERWSRTTAHLIERGLMMTRPTAPRVVQLRLVVTDRAPVVAFYEQVFGATYAADITSIQLGTFPSDEFFLVTIEETGEYDEQGPPGPSRFGFTVDDLDATHARALAHGGQERYPPVSLDWKPRTSCVVDPGGNWVDLYQA